MHTTEASVGEHSRAQPTASHQGGVPQLRNSMQSMTTGGLWAGTRCGQALRDRTRLPLGVVDSGPDSY